MSSAVFPTARAPAGRGRSAESFASNHAYFSAVIRRVAEAEGALLIDLAAAEWETTDLYDRIHFTDQGSEKAATPIAAALARAIEADPAFAPRLR